MTLERRQVRLHVLCVSRFIVAALALIAEPTAWRHVPVQSTIERRLTIRKPNPITPVMVNAKFWIDRQDVPFLQAACWTSRRVCILSSDRAPETAKCSRSPQLSHMSTVVASYPSHPFVMS